MNSAVWLYNIHRILVNSVCNPKSHVWCCPKISINIIWQVRDHVSSLSKTNPTITFESLWSFFSWIIIVKFFWFLYMVRVYENRLHFTILKKFSKVELIVSRRFQTKTTLSFPCSSWGFNIHSLNVMNSASVLLTSWNTWFLDNQML